MPIPTVALVDTDIFSAVFVDPDGAARRGLPLDSWRQALTGVHVIVSFQTRVEVLAGVHGSNWGERKIAAAVARLDAVPTVPADRQVMDAYVDLSVRCRRAGHALHDKVHTADRWIAACAVAKDVSLFSSDGIYEGAPGLSLLT